MNNEILLQVNNLFKSFGATKALKGISLTIRPGEIHGLVGENGSGKSTATSIIAGMQPGDDGEMLFTGSPWHPRTMIEAQDGGISMILQEANTISGATVAENLFIGQESRFARLGFVSRRKMNQAADAMLRDFGVEHIHGDDSIDRLGFEDRKLVEIVRTIKEHTRILVVDETTTALSHTGRDLLYRLIQKMADQGHAVIFISHDLDEIMSVCNILTVLRDGEIIGSLRKDEMEARTIRHMMVGREIGDAFYRDDFNPAHDDEVVLELTDIAPGGKPFSIQLHKGEILGLGGLSESGMHDVGRIAFGIQPTAGKVWRLGQLIQSPQQAIRLGLGYISKNRDNEALILQGSIKDNIMLPSLSRISKLLFVSPAAERRIVDDQISFLRLKCNNSGQFVSTLSGGNKQKVSFARWTAKDADVLIMDCPTRGVDVGVKQAMYQLIADMKKSGKAILMISEELAELIGMCDRILIMKDYDLSKEFIRHEDLKETDIIEFMI